MTEAKSASPQPLLSGKRKMAIDYSYSVNGSVYTGKASVCYMTGSRRTFSSLRCETYKPRRGAELLRYIDSVSTDRRLFLPMLWEAYHEQRLPVSKKISAQGNGAEEDWFQVIELPRHPRSQGQEPSCRAKEGTCYLVHASQGKLEMVDSFHLVSAPVLSFQSKNSLLITEEDGKDATVYRKRFRLYQISKTGEVKGPEILQYHRVTGSAAQQSGG